jgi:hypothetical protein
MPNRYFTKAELARHCAVDASSVTKALRADRLVTSMRNNNPVIDIKHKKNIDQVNKWIDAKTDSPDDGVIPPDKVKKVKVQRTARQKIDDEKARIDLEAKKMRLETQKLEARKLRGEMVPTELIASLFQLLGGSFQSVYKTNAENMLNELFHRAKVDPAIAAEFKGQLIEVINEAHSEAVDNVQDQLKRIAKDQG